jgi:hypothetical protein
MFSVSARDAPSNGSTSRLTVSAITRAYIAAFLLDQLTDTRFRRAAPTIGNQTPKGPHR